jgi:hypothetical protein|tara:strand:+ start:361 stop:783 length:423 start_codon:yes stop_codon:yes gene_type:complete
MVIHCPREAKMWLSGAWFSGLWALLGGGGARFGGSAALGQWTDGRVRDERAGLAARSEKGEQQRGRHEKDSRAGGQFPQYSGGAARTEKGVARSPAEGGADAAAFSGLKEYEKDQRNGGEDMDDSEKYAHVIAINSLIII